MKKKFNLFKYAIACQVRSTDNETRVSLKYKSLNLREVELKKKMVEDWPIFLKIKLPRVIQSQWNTQPEPILKSNLTLELEFDLTKREKMLHIISPNMLLSQLEKYARNILIPFFELSPKKIKTSFWKSWLISPVRLFLEDVHYKEINLTLTSEFVWTDDFVSPLLFEGKLKCLIRISRLKRIEYLITSRYFVNLAPKIGEIYVKAKLKSNSGGYGDSLYVFQGSFLEQKEDQYLLSYWSLEPIWQIGLLAQIPESMLNEDHFSTKSQIRIIENKNRGYLDFLEEKTVTEIMSSAFPDATSSHNHLK